MGKITIKTRGRRTPKDLITKAFSKAVKGAETPEISYEQNVVVVLTESNLNIFMVRNFAKNLCKHGNRVIQESVGEFKFSLI